MSTHGRSGDSKAGLAADAEIHPESTESRAANSSATRKSRDAELRLFGLNACRAVFERRPRDIRKAWLTERRVADVKPMLAWLARERVGYTLVADDDLERLTQSQHHEGVGCGDRKLQFLAIGVQNLAAHHQVGNLSVIGHHAHRAPGAAVLHCLG